METTSTPETQEDSADLREGIRAFQEKRDPTFTDT